MVRRLLIAEDAIFMRRVIRDVAAEAEWEVVAEATNGMEAMQKFEQFRPDLVVLDLGMPNVGGLEVLKQIRAHEPNTKVAVISELDQKGTILEALRAGAFDYIVKPFERSRLLGMFAKAAG